MAQYHFAVTVMSRAHGRNAVHSAAYRSGSELTETRTGQVFDYTGKPHVVHSEILKPDNAPAWMTDRQQLWNAVEAGEKRHDAQLAREVTIAIPIELTENEGIALARHYAQREFVQRGMVADLNIHWEPDNPHAHVMLTMREVTPDGFGPKNRGWNRTPLLHEWREHWADLANVHLARAGHDMRIDHRSYEAQGIELEPSKHRGRKLTEMRERGIETERGAEYDKTRERNAKKIEKRPEIVLETLTHKQSTFTRRDIAREVFRYIDNGDRFRDLMARVEGSPELVRLTSAVRDERGELIEPARYTTREMLTVESRLSEHAGEMAENPTHGVSSNNLDRALSKHNYLSPDQQEAVRHITGDQQISALTGFAGAGKSKAVEAAKDAWERAGYRVHGAALAGIASENLQKESGVESRTLASWELAWKEGRATLGRRDVLVMDEAGMVGSRQMERIVSEVHRRGAKLVLVGDAGQLQAIEAGAAFRVVAEQVGYSELSAIRRQVEGWQREASRDFARQIPGQALDRYQAHGNIHFAADTQQAKAEIIEKWAGHHSHHPKESSLILAHTRADVRDLNEQARAILHERGELGRDVRVKTSREIQAQDGTVTVERSERNFAVGDRVMFLQNDKKLGVKNGTLGQVLSVSSEGMRVQLDSKERKIIALDFPSRSYLQTQRTERGYAALDHGYAATVHKSQGTTVGRTFVLATPGMDRHMGYVAMTRHIAGVEVYAGRDQFKGGYSELKETLSRNRPKDSTLDYVVRRGREIDMEQEPRKQEQKSERDPKIQRKAAQAQERQGEPDAVARFVAAQRQMMAAASQVGIDPQADTRLMELDGEMKTLASEISNNPELSARAERAGVKSQVAEMTYLAEREKEQERDHDAGHER